MQQRSCNAYVRRGPAPRPLIIVEDDRLDLTTLDLSPPGASAFDIVTCSGPEGGEACPLVTDGRCPAGRPHVVVTNLSEANEWRASVRAAWILDGVPVVDLRADAEWPAHVGAAVQSFFGADDDPASAELYRDLSARP